MGTPCGAGTGIARAPHWNLECFSYPTGPVRGLCETRKGAIRRVGVGIRGWGGGGWGGGVGGGGGWGGGVGGGVGGGGWGGGGGGGGVGGMAQSKACVIPPAMFN